MAALAQAASKSGNVVIYRGGFIVRCGRCGNDNPESNRFCGMCGATLLPSAQPPVSPSVIPERSIAREAAAAPEPVLVSRPQVRTPIEVPPISGHSFLGLNQPSSESTRGTNLGRGSHLERSSGSLDYLLEDEEEPRRGSVGKIFAVLVVLALVLGWSYFHWHDQLSALLAATTKPAATAPSTSDPGQAGTSNAPSDGNSAGTSATSNPTPVPQTPAVNPPAATTSAPVAHGQSAVRGSDAGQVSDAAGSSGPTPAANANPPAPAGTDTEDSAAQGDMDNDSKAPAAAPVRPAKPQPVPKPTPVKSADPVVEAERYIYGRNGSAQDCDRGLRTLRPAAEQANPGAMISLGALYSTGVCTPRDLPTAYRWFAKALRKQPDNQPLQENLQRLWGQMTQPERQLAIKLSQ
jgi:hypothetical protein